jgi:hypothetical protein
MYTEKQQNKIHVYKMYVVFCNRVNKCVYKQGWRIDRRSYGERRKSSSRVYLRLIT